MALTVSSLESKINVQIAKSKRNARNLDFNCSFDIKRNVRLDLIERYKKDILSNSRKISKSTNIAEIVSSTNIPYSKRINGLYYPDDYIRNINSEDNWKILQGVANTYYWDISTHDCFFKIKEGRK